MAVSKYTEAAEAGDVDAQYDLGQLKIFGPKVGLEQDFAGAAKWWGKGAEAGHLKCMLNYGMMLKKGDGVAEDKVEAAKWFRKAAEEGCSKSMIQLARMLHMGDGIPQDSALATEWLVRLGRTDPTVLEMIDQIERGDLDYKRGDELMKKVEEMKEVARKHPTMKFIDPENNLGQT